MSENAIQILKLICALGPLFVMLAAAIASRLRAKKTPRGNLAADVLIIAAELLDKKGHGEELLQAVKEELDSPEAHELARFFLEYRKTPPAGDTPA
jgi:hypothetical protein